MRVYDLVAKEFCARSLRAWKELWFIRKQPRPWGIPSEMVPWWVIYIYQRNVKEFLCTPKQLSNSKFVNQLFILYISLSYPLPRTLPCLDMRKLFLFNLVKAASLLDTIKRKEIVKILLAPISIKPFQLSDVLTKKYKFSTAQLSTCYIIRQVPPDFLKD